MKQDNRLVIVASNSDSVPSRELGGAEGLIGAMQAIGFVGAERVGHDGLVYEAGDKLFDYISMVGCSPVLQLVAEYDEEPAGFISFSPVYDQPQFIYSSSSVTPSCRSCKKPLSRWSACLGVPMQVSDSSQLTDECEECGEQSALSDLKFRKDAGVGRYFIYVHGIYPREAVPVDGLLIHLEKFMGCRMSYFYLQK